MHHGARVLRGGRAEKATFGDATDHIDQEIITYENCNAYLDEVEAMADSILDGASPTIALEDSRGNIATLVALYTSARENRVVTL